ncbi:MAG TPA: FIST N-terminal domain-containing protein [Rhodothermia bacterium]|nr:FIST N-terminal domain-containing protein [Rhodothermia bacterium]
MIVEQKCWSETSGWRASRTTGSINEPQLVLFFGAPEAIVVPSALDALRVEYPNARIMGCSTAGEIRETHVDDGTIVATAIRFEHTRVRTSCHPLGDASGSAAVGERIARDLSSEGLTHVFVLAEGLHVNGSELVTGLRSGLPANVAVTGGLAGDGARFKQTNVYCDGMIDGGGVAAVGFYGGHLRVGYGSMGGWDSFGPDRLITRAKANVLYELDGGSALELYKRYLGPHAATLPASGLLFPLSLRSDTGDPRVVRTILGIDEDAGSLVFAGDIPEGGYARLMKANVDRLIDGAHGAATACYEPLGTASPSLALLISCVGRKLVLKQRTEEEVESVRAVLGEGTVLSGFYSYGEIAPFAASTRCELHNQTMTITTLTER